MIAPLVGALCTAVGAAETALTKETFRQYKSATVAPLETREAVGMDLEPPQSPGPEDLDALERPSTPPSAATHTAQCIADIIGCAQVVLIPF